MPKSTSPEIPSSIAKLRAETDLFPLRIEILLSLDRDESTVDQRGECRDSIRESHYWLLSLFHSDIERDSEGLITREWLRSVTAATGRAIRPSWALAERSLDSCELEKDKAELAAILLELRDMPQRGRDAMAVSDLRPIRRTPRDTKKKPGRPKNSYTEQRAAFAKSMQEKGRSWQDTCDTYKKEYPDDKEANASNVKAAYFSVENSNRPKS